MRGRMIVALAAAGLTVGAVTGCAAAQDATGTGNASLTYEVGGSATSASITYSTGGGNIAQETSATLPWSKTVEVSGMVAGNSVQAQNAGGCDISCKITRDGEVVAENTSSGEFAIASCVVP